MNRRSKPNTFYPHSCPASQLEGLPDGYGKIYMFNSSLSHIHFDYKNFERA